MGLFDETNTTTTSRFAPSLFNILTSGGSKINTAQTGTDTFKAGVELPQDIQGLRAENLSGIRSLLSQIRGEQGSILDARLRPMRDKFDAQGGELRRDLGRRNVSGTLANNEITNFNTRSGQALGDARSLATRDLIGVESGLNSQIGDQANAVLAQELASLGIGESAISNIIASMSTSSRTDTSSDPAGQIGGIGDLLEIIGRL